MTKNDLKSPPALIEGTMVTAVPLLPDTYLRPFQTYSTRDFTLEYKQTVRRIVALFQNNFDQVIILFNFVFGKGCPIGLRRLHTSLLVSRCNIASILTKILA